VRLRIHSTLLHDKRAFQKPLERFAIKGGRVTHNGALKFCGRRTRWALAGEADKPVSQPAVAVSHRGNAVSMGQRLHDFGTLMGV
jgi:hypothetical protein